MNCLGLASPPRRVLVVGAHADDVEIGCGGTILTLVRKCPDLQLTWVVLAASGEREREAHASAHAFANGAALDVRLFGFRDGFFPSVVGDIKTRFEELKPLEPDLILTHTRDDLHQDHRLACELTWNTFRDQLILEYEVPKWDGDLGRPNVFVPLTAETAETKVRLLHEHFRSQRDKDWFDAETFNGLMRLRGLEIRAEERFAEAFVGRKLGIGFRGVSTPGAGVADGGAP